MSQPSEAFRVALEDAACELSGVCIPPAAAFRLLAFTREAQARVEAREAADDR